MIPTLEKVVAECCECESEIYETDEVIYDVEGSVYYCNDRCLANFITKHPYEFLELMINEGLVEKTHVQTKK